MGSLNVDSLFTNIPLEETIIFVVTHCSKKQIFMRATVNLNLKLYSLWHLKSPIFSLMRFYKKKKTGYQWGHLWVQLWLMPFYRIMKKFGLNDFPRKSNLYFIEGMLMTFLFYLSLKINPYYFEIISVVVILECRFQMKLRGMEN